MYVQHRFGRLDHGMTLFSIKQWELDTHLDTHLDTQLDEMTLL